jgi:hypothetical protein
VLSWRDERGVGVCAGVAVLDRLLVARAKEVRE